MSIKALEIAVEKQAVAQYGSSDSGASLGDILGAAMKQRDDTVDEDTSSGEPASEAASEAVSEAASEAVSEPAPSEPAEEGEPKSES